MRINKIPLLVLFILLTFLNTNKTKAQIKWIKQSKLSYSKGEKKLYNFEHLPSDYQIYKTDFSALNSSFVSKSANIGSIISLPDSDGVTQKFKIKETSNFHKKLQLKFPNIKSYTAIGLDDETSVAKISVGTDGFHAVIYSGLKGTLFIDPYSRDNQDYIVYKKNVLNKVNSEFECLVKNEVEKEVVSSTFSKTANDGKLRTYRMALVCSGGYSEFHLNRQNVASTATDTEKKAAVLSAMNTSITRVNGVFEKDLAVKLELVADNDKIIFLDEDTDGITDGSASTMIDEVQTICDTQIGDANYDIGHIFSLGGDGLAGLGVVCITGQKARGVTGIGSPIGDAYDIDYVIHELGHQFGATHTQNNDCNRTSSTAVEPGSGSTIMGYAGICNPNVLGVGSATGNSDDYFHAISIEQMWSVVQSTGTCATETNTNNIAPTANAGTDVSIPKSTPFKLVGTATDADGLGSLTYNWEQIDNEVGAMPPTSVNTVGPMFRSLPSKTVPLRYFPELATVVGGNTSTTWEVLPSVARELNFSFLVRDNHAGGGSTARDDIKITVTDAQSFSVTAPSTATTWDVGTKQTITWEKGTTDIAPINCALVNIKLSLDGGVTFPITLLENTANDGTEEIIIPNNPTTSARIMVEAADNIFYNVNATNFTINSTTPTFILTNTSGNQVVCNFGNNTVDYILNFDFVNGFSETASLSATGVPSGANVVFTPNTISTDGNVTMSISNLDNTTAQDYQINVVASSNTISQDINVNLKVTSNSFGNLTLTSPSDGATNISLVEELQWDADSNATSYDVEIASDSNFTNIVSSGNVDTNAYVSNNLSGTTQYFWRVKPKNSCGEGTFTSPFSFTTLSPNYCSSTFTDEAGGTEHILNVTFGGINNDSDNDTTDGYQDFTSINTNVLRGQTREISVRFDTGGFQDHCYVFIDWNQDFVFDKSTERYDLGTILEDVGTSTLNITVPNDARLGTTRMRVVIEYDDPSDGFGDGACDADHLTEWGETEDYSVTVVQPMLNANNYVFTKTDETVFNGNNGSINLAINQEEFTYNITATGPSTNIDETFVGKSYELTNLAPGKYVVCVKAIEINNTQCFEIDIEEAVGAVNSNNYLIRTSSETCFGENDGVIDVGISQQEFSYNITITGNTTNINQAISGFSYSLSGLEPGDYEICITANEISETRCFQVTIEPAQQIALKVASKTKSVYNFKIDKGTAPYHVYLNDDLVGISSVKDFDLEIKGTGRLKVKSSKDCEGVFEKSIGDIFLIKNPISDFIEISLPFTIEESEINTYIFDINGKLVLNQKIKIEENNLRIPFQKFAKGIYILKLPINNTKPLKILKQ